MRDRPDSAIAATDLHDTFLASLMKECPDLVERSHSSRCSDSSSESVAGKTHWSSAGRLDSALDSAGVKAAVTDANAKYAIGGESSSTSSAKPVAYPAAPTTATATDSTGVTAISRCFKRKRCQLGQSGGSNSSGYARDGVAAAGSTSGRDYRRSIEERGGTEAKVDSEVSSCSFGSSRESPSRISGRVDIGYGSEILLARDSDTEFSFSFFES